MEERMWCPRCEINMLPVLVMVIGPSINGPAEYELACPECGLMEEHLCSFNEEAEEDE